MTLNLTNLLASQVTNYILHDRNYSIEQLKKINYVTAANGLFRVEKSAIGIFKTLIAPTVASVPGLNEMEAGVELTIPRIPFRYLQMALSFYRDVHTRDKTEASLLFFWNKDNVKLPERYSDGKPIQGLLVDGQLVIYVPRQKNSSTLSEFHMDTAVDWFRSNLALLCETHSHHTMKAFFSATDNANENATQFYGVWGLINNEEPSFAFRYCSGDAKIAVPAYVLFDWPIMTTTITKHVAINQPGFMPTTTTEEKAEMYQGPFAHEPYPGEWMDQVQIPLRPPAGAAFLNRQESLFDDRYNDSVLNTGYAIPLSKTNMFAGNDGFEFATAVHINETADLSQIEDIMNNIGELTEDYKRLGFDRMIENTIKDYRHSLV